MAQLSLAFPMVARNAAFLLACRNEARRICAEHGCVTTDDVREAIPLLPDTPHCFGAIFTEPGWICVGQQRSRIKSNNGRFIRIFAWKPEVTS